MATADTEPEPTSRHATPEESFDDVDDRRDAMAESIESWIADLAEMADTARASEQFQEWLDVHARFHDYSPRNSLLIKLQKPDATKVAGFWDWQNKFDRHVKEGEKAIWIWAPIITEKCPECGNSESYHDRDHIDCTYHEESDPDTWREGVVGFKPASVFDISQTEGEPLPELDTAAGGDADGLVEALLEAADRLDIDATLVPNDEWDRSAEGYTSLDQVKMAPLVRVRDKDNRADVARVLIHEFAHAEIHGGVTETTEAKEVEADAVAYVVCRYFGLDTSNIPTYLAAWSDDAPDKLEERLETISNTAQRLIKKIPHEHAE